MIAPLSADDWPQFRGPNCTGISHSSRPLPVTFSNQKGIAWSVKLGDGIGCPVVAGGRVFVSAMMDERTVGLLAFDEKTGRKLWQRTWPTGTLTEIHATNSHASSTPATDGKRVYFYFTNLGLKAVDAVSGADVWQRKLPVPFFVFKWGAGISPVVYRGMVLFVQDDDLNPALYAFDSKTGKLLWKDDRTEMAVNYSHPVICTTQSGDEIVVAGTGLLIAYEPRTGRRLWWARTLLRNIKTTPVSENGIVYISLQSGGIANQWIQAVDEAPTGNRDGKLTKAEIKAFVGNTQSVDTFLKRTFDRGDLNKDGVLEGAEIDTAFLPADNFAGARFGSKNAADEFILAVRGGGRGDVTATQVMWKHPSRYTDHIVSPLVIDGRMLLIKGGGIATCFEIKKGERLWGPSRIQNAYDYFASPVYGDGKIYVAGVNGTVVVLKNGPTLEILAKNDVGDSIVGTPAIADGRLLIRLRHGLLCVADGKADRLTMQSSRRQ